MERKRKQAEEDKYEVLSVEALSLTGAIRSKKDIYDFFAFKMQYFLPPFKECSVCKELLMCSFTDHSFRIHEGFI